MSNTHPAQATTILRGQTLAYRGDPFEVAPEAAVEHHSDGAVVIAGTKIAEVGPAAAVLARHPGVPIDSYPGHLIMAGFVDCHVHYPQIDIIASYGEQLFAWLEKYTFPCEAKFGDRAHGDETAHTFLDECLRHGTTSASVYCTVHPHSVDAFFSAAQQRNFCVAAGKVLMDSNARDDLLDTAERGYAESKALIARWHGVGRLTYAVTPRFAVTSSPAQLEAAATLWKEHPTTLLQTHLAENALEVERVKALHPVPPDYLGIYEKYGLCGCGAHVCHAIHRQAEIVRCVERFSFHCPTSNQLIGSGLFDMQTLRERTSNRRTATDAGGGSSCSMFTTMKAAYEICQLGAAASRQGLLSGNARCPASWAWMIDRQLAAGFDADVVVLDLKSQALIAPRMAHIDDIWGPCFCR
jgi:guanine deaminase